MGFLHRSYDEHGHNVTMWCASKSDPRWNATFRTDSFWTDDVAKHIARLTKELGEPPDDLEYGGVKD